MFISKSLICDFIHAVGGAVGSGKDCTMAQQRNVKVRTKFCMDQEVGDVVRKSVIKQFKNSEKVGTF
jgi:hypothetical protein